MNNPTTEQFLAAMKIVEDYGRNKFRDEVKAEQPIERCIGIAIAGHISDPATVATEVLEQHNYHLEVAVLGAMCQAKGTFQRDENVVVVRHPYYHH